MYDKFWYGELGYNGEEEFNSLDEAIDAAVEHSIGTGLTPICVWDKSDDVLAVVVAGEIFDKRNK